MTTLALVLALAAAAPAQQADPEPAIIDPVIPSASARAGDSNVPLDPNQIVCRSDDAVGTRLRGLRRCATRAQWAEFLRLERQYVEKTQTNRTWCGGVCVRSQNHGR